MSSVALFNDLMNACTLFWLSMFHQDLNYFVESLAIYIYKYSIHFKIYISGMLGKCFMFSVKAAAYIHKLYHYGNRLKHWLRH